jgi:dihydrofolate reductase
MKAEDGADILLACGADLFAQMTKAGLIDEYRFLVAPIALGRGKALFGSLQEPLRLRLTNSTTTSGGGVLLEYVPQPG